MSKIIIKGFAIAEVEDYHLGRSRIIKTNTGKYQTNDKEFDSLIDAVVDAYERTKDVLPDKISFEDYYLRGLVFRWRVSRNHTSWQYTDNQNYRRFCLDTNSNHNKSDFIRAHDAGDSKLEICIDVPRIHLQQSNKIKNFKPCRH